MVAYFGRSMNNRRKLIVAFGAGSLVVPFASVGQQPAMPVIGYLSNGSPAAFAPMVAAFRQGLSEAGYVEGQNVVIEYRWAEGQNDRLSALVTELLRRQAAVIVATGGSSPALAAKAATPTIPIVFTGGIDPVKLGLVASLARPGGNATGVINIAELLTTKRLEILSELVPSATMIAVLLNPNNPDAEIQAKELEVAGLGLKQKIRVFHAASERAIDNAFVSIVKTGANALLVGADPFFTSRRNQLVALAARHAIPASYSFSEFAAAGGLISYGASIPDKHRQAGVYAGRILKGAKPADLPVMQPTKFELIVNRMAAKALGIKIPNSILLRADRVIE